MIQVCYYCHQIYGEKEPLDNPEETSGECPLCHSLFITWYELRKKESTNETATQFILRGRDLNQKKNDQSLRPPRKEVRP